MMSVFDLKDKHLMLIPMVILEEDLEDGSEEHKICAEIVELCGRLPLTLAIAGGMVAETGQGFNDDVRFASLISHPRS